MGMEMLCLRKRTEPSPKRKFEPPAWKLANPLAAAPKRHPSGAVAPCQLLTQLAEAGSTVFEFQLIGMVIPWIPPFWNQKLLSAARDGNTSPARTVLLVPSITLAMVAGCAVPR